MEAEFQKKITQLTDMSILDIDDDNSIANQNRIKEQDKIIEKLGDYVSKGYIAQSIYVDKANKDSAPTYELGRDMEDVRKNMECHDIKNGGEFILYDNEISLITYGQGYTYITEPKEYHLVTEVTTYRSLPVSYEKAESLYENDKTALEKLYVQGKTIPFLKNIEKERKPSEEKQNQNREQSKKQDKQKREQKKREQEH